MPDTRRRVGQYEIARLIGRGGVATVHLARDLALERWVALKQLAVVQLDVPGLSHPNAVTVFEHLEHEGVPYMAMEYLEHGSLRPLVGELSVAQFGGVMEGMLAALRAAGEQGIVHGDLKPENVLITDDGRVKIADFGLATAVGTPTYMAPEQAMAQQLGPWTDLYATGVTAYELLAGRPPFADIRTTMPILMAHVHTPPPPLAELRPDLDPRLVAWVEWLLAKAPAERPPDAGAAWGPLEDVLLDVLGPHWRREAPLVDEGERITPTPRALAPTTPPPPHPPHLTLETPPAPRPHVRKRRAAAIGGLALAALTAIVVAAVLLVGGDDEEPPAAGFTVGLRDELRPVQRANEQLSAALDTLRGGSSAATAIDRVTAASETTRAARTALADLSPGKPPEPSRHADATTALRTEDEYLELVATILRERANAPQLAGLEPLADRLTADLRKLDGVVDGLSASVGGAGALAGWATGPSSTIDRGD